MRLPITIEGIDCSSHVNMRNYSIGYKPIDGGFGGVMIDGTTTLDILDYKCVLQLDLNSLTGVQLSALLTAIIKPYVTVTYWDTVTNASRTSVFMPQMGSAIYAFVSNGQKRFESGTTLTLTER